MFESGTKDKRQRIEEKQKILREECANKTFRLIGVVNLFSIVPDFVYPVFVCEQDGRKYFQDCDTHTLNIIGFEPAKPVIGQRVEVKLLEQIKKNEFEPPMFTIDSRAVLAFQISEEDYFIECAEGMKRFLENYKTEDKILKSEIEDYLRILTKLQS